jgi:hypothetical protein
MFDKIRNASRVQLVSYFLFAASFLILLASAYMTFNVDVLKNWKLTLPEQKIYAGDKITVQSVYTKTMNVKGESVRYLDCQNKDDITIRYPLNQAIADRAARAGGTGVVVVMPDTVPDLPAKCRVSIVIDYPVFPWRHVIETNETEEFTLHPVRKSSASSVRDVSQKTNQTLAPITNLQSSSSDTLASSFNSTPKNTTAQRDISQGEPVRNQTVELEPTPEEKPDEPITGIPLIDAVLNKSGEE